MSYLDMTAWDAHLLFAFSNLIVASAVGWICICRFTLMSGGSTRRFTRAAYVGLFGAMFLSGWQPAVLREWPGWADLLANVAILVHLLSLTHAWALGLPQFAKSGPAPLSDPEVSS